MFEAKQYTKEEIQQKLKEKREWMKNNREYYGNGPVSQKKDYIWYKNFLYSNMKS